MKIIDLLVLITVIIFLIYTAATARAVANIMDVATYEDEYLNVVTNLDELVYGGVISSGIAYKNTMDLVKLLPVPKNAKGTLAYFKEYNTLVNNYFRYRSDASNYWYTQPPILSVLLNSGDCKAYAIFKYDLLKQLGYKNVKIVTVLLADGRGGLAGHAVTMLNDIWIFDINYPYFYPFAYLRANNAIEGAFDDFGTYNVKRLKD